MKILESNLKIASAFVPMSEKEQTQQGQIDFDEIDDRIRRKLKNILEMMQMVLEDHTGCEAYEISLKCKILFGPAETALDELSNFTESLRHKFDIIPKGEPQTGKEAGHGN